MFQCFVKDISYTRQGKSEKATQLEWKLQGHIAAMYQNQKQVS